MKRVKLELEYMFKASPTILYQFLTTPACLVRWYCDAVDIEDDYYIFSWNGSEEIAELIDDIEEERLKFIWVSAPDGEYLEYKIYQTDITNETLLSITDFCDEIDTKDQKILWDSLMKELKKETGG